MIFTFGLWQRLIAIDTAPVHALRRRRRLHARGDRRAVGLAEEVVALGATAIAPGWSAQLDSTSRSTSRRNSARSPRRRSSSVPTTTVGSTCRTPGRWPPRSRTPGSRSSPPVTSSSRSWPATSPACCTGTSTPIDQSRRPVRGARPGDEGPLAIRAAEGGTPRRLRHPHRVACRGHPAQLCRLRLVFRPELMQSDGVMHGGAIASLLDSVLVPAIGSSLPDGSRFSTSTCTSSSWKASSTPTWSPRDGWCAGAARGVRPGRSAGGVNRSSRRNRSAHLRRVAAGRLTSPDRSLGRPLANRPAKAGVPPPVNRPDAPLRISDALMRSSCRRHALAPTMTHVPSTTHGTDPPMNDAAAPDRTVQSPRPGDRPRHPGAPGDPGQRRESSTPPSSRWPRPIAAGRRHSTVGSVASPPRSATTTS